MCFIDNISNDLEHLSFWEWQIAEKNGHKYGVIYLKNANNIRITPKYQKLKTMETRWSEYGTPRMQKKSDILMLWMHFSS